jgi:hypothetical protein
VVERPVVGGALGDGLAPVGTQAVLAGGSTDGTSITDTVDVYDSSTGQWATGGAVRDAVLGGMESTLQVLLSNAHIKCNLSHTRLVAAFAPDASIFGDEYLIEKLETSAEWSPPAPDEDYTQGHRAMVQDFVESVAEGRAQKSEGDLGRDVIRLVYGAYVSAAEGAASSCPAIHRPGPPREKGRRAPKITTNSERVFYTLRHVALCSGCLRLDRPAAPAGGNPASPCLGRSAAGARGRPGRAQSGAAVLA